MDFQFKNQTHAANYRSQINHIEEILNGDVDTSRYAWDVTVERYAKCLERIKNLLNDPIFAEDRNGALELLDEQISTCLKRCASPEYQIALVGTIKAGKSTLINALINYELASTAVTPETAALTKFKRADKDCIEISFYSDEEWAELWQSANTTVKQSNNIFVKEYNELNADAVKPQYLNQPARTVVFDDREKLKAEIERRTSSKYPEHYFVKEVVVGLRDFDLPEGVVLIDTPGLNDVVKFRSDITRRYIAQANAVLMCVKADKLEGGDMLILNGVFSNTNGKVNKVYVIATQLDRLNKPKSDWADQLIEWTKYLDTEICYGNQELMYNNVVPTAAYFYTLLERYRNNRLDYNDRRDEDVKAFRSTLPKYDVFERAELNEDFDRLKKETNVELLFRKLRCEVIEGHKHELIDDIRRTYATCAKAIRELMRQKRSEQDQIIADSQKSLEELKKLQAEKSKELEQLERDKNDLESRIETFRAAIKQQIGKLSAEINSAQ